MLAGSGGGHARSRARRRRCAERAPQVDASIAPAPPPHARDDHRSRLRCHAAQCRAKLEGQDPDDGLKRREVVPKVTTAVADEAVVNYFGRSTHRIAISDERIVAASDTLVSFRYKDYRPNGTRRTLTLETGAFIRPYPPHGLPKGLTRVRLEIAQPTRRQEEEIQLANVQGRAEAVGCGKVGDRGTTTRARCSCVRRARRESEYNRGTGSGKTARPGLCGASGDGRPYRGGKKWKIQN